MPGTNTLLDKSTAEVTNISPFGFWVLLNDREYFVAYAEYPGFADATILETATVQTDVAGNLHWPMLDEEIELEALEHPECYPNVYK